MKRMTFEEIEMKLYEIERLEQMASFFNSMLVDCVLFYAEPEDKKTAEKYFESMLDYSILKIRELKGELTK